jgi:hypothetical protein
MAIVSLATDQVSTGIQVPLLPDGNVAGTVRDENGSPQIGVRVQVFVKVGIGSRLDLKAVPSEANTDKAGHFSLPALPPGNYYVLASPDTPAAKQDKSGYAPVPTFFPQAISLQDSSPLLVQAGQTSSADIKLQRSLTHRIEGKIAEFPSGTDPKSLRLQITPSGDLNLAALGQTIIINADLSFSFPNVVAGRYVLKLTSDETGRRKRGHLLGRQEIEVGATDLLGVVIQPTASITLSGMITAQTNSPLAMAAINIRAAPLDERLRGALAYSTAAPDGSFLLRDLEPARYLITVQPSPTGLYVSSLTLNQRDILNQAVDFSNIPGGKIEAVIRSGTGIITGTVPESPAIVIAVPKSVAPDGSNVRVAHAQSHAFGLPNLPPGDYLLYATDSWDSTPWLVPSFLEAVQNLGQAVHLDEGATQQVQVAQTPKNLLQDQAQRVGLNFP